MSEYYYEKLAKFLLDYKVQYNVTPELALLREFSDKYTNAEISAEINQILNSLTTKIHPVLANYKRLTNKSIDRNLINKTIAEDKYYFLEKHHVHDSPLLATLIEFLIIAIALLVRLERMHKKHILCGDVSPYSFMYSKMYHGCEPVDLNKILTDPKNVKLIKQEKGPYLYAEVPISAIGYTKYLAPELIDEVRNYRLKKRLELLINVAKRRNIAVNDLDVSMILKHMKHSITYTNHAEIYSAGFVMNEIFAHSLSKLAYFGYRMNEFVLSKVDPRIITEANLLLPTSFANPDDERVLSLVNELLEYIHALMPTNPEKRVSLQDMIELLESLLKRTSLTRPEDVAEEEEIGIEQDNEAVAEDEELFEDVEFAEEEIEEDDPEMESIEAELEEREKDETKEGIEQEVDAAESDSAELEASELEREQEIEEAEELEREEIEELEKEEVEQEEMQEREELEDKTEKEMETEEREKLEQEEETKEREEELQEFDNEKEMEVEEEVAEHENEEHLEAEKQENVHEGLKEDEKKQRAPDIDSDTDTNIDDDDPKDEPPSPRSTFRP